jgi:outer membrane protein insertion porin family
MAAGVQLFRAQTDYEQATYQSTATGATFSLNFPVTEYSVVGVNYTYEVAEVLPFTNAPLEIRLASGSTYGSIFGYTYSYSNLDDSRKPTKGVAVTFGQGFAGFGGNLKFIKTTGTFSGYQPFFANDLIGSFTLNSGYITAYDSAIVPINQRFFMGGDTFRGFKLAGIGPRDIDAPADQGALGGNVYAIGTLAVRFPNLLPPSWGVNIGLFTDFGTLGKIDTVIRACTPNTSISQGTCDKDNLALRASGGLSIGWQSPFGPIQVDLAVPYIKTPYDRPQVLHLSTATGL